MFSAADARDVLEIQRQRRKNLAMCTKKIRLHDTNDIRDSDVDTLSFLYLRYIEMKIRSRANKGDAKYEGVLVPSRGFLADHFYSGCIPSDAQLDVLRERLVGRIVTTLQQHKYKVSPITNTYYRIVWSTTPRARHQWRLLVAYLTVRCALKKYVRRRMDAWLTPPHGRLYLKAKNEFSYNCQTF